MSLIIRNDRLSSSANDTLCKKIEANVRSVIDKDFSKPPPLTTLEPQDFENDTEQPSPDALSPAIRPELQSDPMTRADGSLQKLRKLIPAEVLVAWATCKLGLDDAYATTVAYSAVWGGFVILVFIYILFSLRRDRIALHYEQDLSTKDLAAQAAVSTGAFVVYSMTLGAPFTLWNFPQWVPFVAMGASSLFISILGDPYVAPKSKKS